tara:strand:- start:563 stop:1693 length:1131 start_codon:yes stop_codon:yes gene_type:complete
MQDIEPLGIYLHIPFCESICNYCNFNRGLLDSSVKQRYVDALEKEILAAATEETVDSVYFGGGTPSLLTPREIERLIFACKDAFRLKKFSEITLETNPETVSIDLLEKWFRVGVNRISFGVQSFLDEELSRLGRLHSSAKARQSIQEALSVGFDVSVDLMFWLPMQTRDDCSQSIDALLDLQPHHASLYILELYPNSPLREEMSRASWSQAPDEDVANMYLNALSSTDAAGYEQYEISNIALPEKRCRHNLKYWQDGEWMGFGCGAYSTRKGQRWKNILDTEQYIKTIFNGHSTIIDRHELTREERVGDVIFTGLRLTEGLDLEKIAFKYGIDVMERYGERLRPFLDSGLLVHSDGYLRLTRSGMLVSNEVMGTFV